MGPVRTAVAVRRPRPPRRAAHLAAAPPARPEDRLHAWWADPRPTTSSASDIPVARRCGSPLPPSPTSASAPPTASSPAPAPSAPQVSKAFASGRWPARQAVACNKRFQDIGRLGEDEAMVPAGTASLVICVSGKARTFTSGYQALTRALNRLPTLPSTGHLLPLARGIRAHGTSSCSPTPRDHRSRSTSPSAVTRRSATSICNRTARAASFRSCGSSSRRNNRYCSRPWP